MPRIYFTSSACLDEGSGAALHTRGILFGLAKLTEVIPLLAYSKDSTLNKIVESGISPRYLVRTRASANGSVHPLNRLMYTFTFFVYLMIILISHRQASSLFYVRWTYFSFPLIALMAVFRVTYFLEENGKDGPEQLSMGRKFRAYLSTFFEKRAVHYSKGIICVSDEISRYICEKYDYPSYRTTVIPNGVEPGITTKESPHGDLRTILGLKKHSDFIIGFMGKGGYSWHGIEEICNLFDSLEDDTIHLIIFGSHATEQNTPRVHFLGHLDEVKLFPWLHSLDMAFGTMNLQVKGLVQACPIKVGYYLDAGVPVVINYEDIRFGGTSLSS